MSGHRLSVVVPAYNSWHTLPRLLESLAGGSSVPDEVIVVDDGSDTYRPVLLDGLQVRWSRLAHQGPIAARNAGWSMATGEWIVFVDSDCTVDPEWCESYRRAMDQCSDEVAILEGPLKESCPKAFFRHWAENTSPGRFPTANVAYRRETLSAIGGLDARFRWGRFYFREDSDLALRAGKAGSAVWVPGALAVHHGRRIGFARKLLEAGRYALDPELVATHGWSGMAVDGVRLGGIRVPAPRQISAVVVTVLWILALVLGRHVLVLAMLAAILRMAFVLSREGFRPVELPLVLFEQALEPVVLACALLLGTVRTVALHQKGAAANAGI